MDFDHDGQRDIVSGGYMGVPFFIKGSEKGWSEPVVLKDKKGKHLETGRFWNPDTKEHLEGKKPKGGTPARSYAALPFDWDNDGDYDLIRGSSDGQLFLRMNEGTPKKAAFAEESVFLKLTVPGGYAMPITADWNGDKLPDLISGNEKGEVYWFQNTGKIGAPSFADPKKLISSAQEEGLGRGPKSQVEACDWDGDGDLDLLVGDVHLNYIENSRWDNHGYIWLYRREQ